MARLGSRNGSRRVRSWTISDMSGLPSQLTDRSQMRLGTTASTIVIRPGLEPMMSSFSAQTAVCDGYPICPMVDGAGP